MKNGEDFIVPLSDQAIEVLEELKSINPQSKLVFPGFTSNTIKPISAEALLSAIKRLGFDATKHGFRQIASTALNEAGFRPDAIECQLDHHKQGVRAIYNRAQYLDERADMMQWLADTYDAVKRGELTI
jgi:integrase